MKEIYSKICRLCLQITNDLLPIHDSSDTICNTIMACTVIKISKDDGLPDNICTSCMQKLNSSYEFKQLCETSDVFLRNYDIGVDSVEFEPETVKDEEIIVVSPTVKDEVAISVKEEELAEKTVSEQFEIIYAYSDTIEEIEADDSLVQYEPEPQPEPEPEQKVTEKPQIPDLLPIKKQKSGRKKVLRRLGKKFPNKKVVLSVKFVIKCSLMPVT
ncbi:uncharacterized protein LOC113372379 [Ctenocephalides felis]|uniref:uncharacterized protein LOC113372379 n=1 Tax=Ctenocephalides felis TaxID=7515 RepID=UPI000E6E1F41|nr:uncharacterized protein LOC113372379 [Ctenocephalides felis]